MSTTSFLRQLGKVATTDVDWQPRAFRDAHGRPCQKGRRWQGGTRSEAPPWERRRLCPSTPFRLTPGDAFPWMGGENAKHRALPTGGRSNGWNGRRATSTGAEEGTVRQPGPSDAHPRGVKRVLLVGHGLLDACQGSRLTAIRSSLQRLPPSIPGGEMKCIGGGCSIGGRKQPIPQGAPATLSSALSPSPSPRPEAPLPLLQFPAP
jgi:hypothetical protein